MICKMQSVMAAFLFWQLYRICPGIIEMQSEMTAFFYKENFTPFPCEKL